MTLWPGQGWFRGRKGRQLSWGLFLRALGAVQMGMFCPTRPQRPQDPKCPKTPSAPFLLPRGESRSWSVALTSLCLPVGAGPALETLLKQQQVEEATVPTAGDLPAGTTRLFLGMASCLQGSHELSPSFSLPLKR